MYVLNRQQQCTNIHNHNQIKFLPDAALAMDFLGLPGVDVTYSDEIGFGTDGAEHLLSLGEVQSTNVPADIHSTSKISILQTSYKLLSECLQQKDTTYYPSLLIQPHWSTPISTSYKE